MKQLWFDIVRRDGVVVGKWINVSRLICAGYSGRDKENILKHIKELESIGVPPPSSVPAKYMIPPDNLTTATKITVSSSTTSGEAEYVIFIDDAIYVGVGSDHTDREIERRDVNASKTCCPKVVGRKLWLYEEVKDHWDELRLYSKVNEGDKLVDYQVGTLKEILPPEELLNVLSEGGRGTCVFSGTIPLKRNVIYSNYFSMALEDPVIGREIKHSYKISLKQQELNY
jgi:hypothetical protein